MNQSDPCRQEGLSTGCHERPDIHNHAWMKFSTADDFHNEGRKCRPRPPSGRQVLLIQKRAIERQAMAGMLTVLGYGVTAVAESGKALLYFGRTPCRLVISDLDMPELNGFQLARYIRRHSPQTHIVLMTACCQAEVVDYMDNRVVNGWLFKPFPLGLLSDILDRVVWSQQEKEWKI